MTWQEDYPDAVGVYDRFKEHLESVNFGWMLSDAVDCMGKDGAVQFLSSADIEAFLSQFRTFNVLKNIALVPTHLRSDLPAILGRFIDYHRSNRDAISSYWMATDNLRG